MTKTITLIVLFLYAGISTTHAQRSHDQQVADAIIRKNDRSIHVPEFFHEVQKRSGALTKDFLEMVIKDLEARKYEAKIGGNFFNVPSHCTHDQTTKMTILSVKEPDDTKAYVVIFRPGEGDNIKMTFCPKPQQNEEGYYLQ